MLVEYFINQICNEYGVASKEIEPDAVQALQEVNWTGNIRELRNVVERLIILSGKAIAKEDVLHYVIPASAAPSLKLQEVFDRFKRIEDLQHFIQEEFDNYHNHKVS